jgi:hypothetical protein
MKGNKHDLIIILVLNLILLSRLINTLVWQRDAAHRTRTRHLRLKGRGSLQLHVATSVSSLSHHERVVVEALFQIMFQSGPGLRLRVPAHARLPSPPRALVWQHVRESLHQIEGRNVGTKQKVCHHSPLAHTCQCCRWSLLRVLVIMSRFFWLPVGPKTLIMWARGLNKVNNASKSIP